MQKVAIALISIVIVTLTSIIVIKYNTVEEVIPEKEVEEIELKRTFVRIFYSKIESSDVGYKDYMISTSDLISDPYSYVLKLIMQDPNEEGMESLFLPNVKILNVDVSNNCVTIDFSNEFNDCFTGNYQKLEKILKCLKYSFESFTEIEKINILVENEEIPMATEILNKI